MIPRMMASLPSPPPSDSGDVRWPTMAHLRFLWWFAPPLRDASTAGCRGRLVLYSRTPRQDGDLSASNVPRFRGFWPGALRVPEPGWSPSVFFCWMDWAKLSRSLSNINALSSAFEKAWAMVDWGRPFGFHSDSPSDMIGEINQHHHARKSKQRGKKRKTRQEKKRIPPKNRYTQTVGKRVVASKR